MGFHFSPNRKFNGPIFAIAGIPFANIKMQINTTAAIDTHAVRMKTHFIMNSLASFMLLLLSEKNCSVFHFSMEYGTVSFLFLIIYCTSAQSCVSPVKIDIT